MAQNVTIAGASYTDVPSIEVPKTGGGTAVFVDPSVVTAVAADVAQGKYFLDSSGRLTEGTNQGGSGGGDVLVYSLPAPIFCDGTSAQVVDTGVQLYHDYSTFTMLSEIIPDTSGVSNMTAIHCKYENSSKNYPGFSIDRSNNGNNIRISCDGSNTLLSISNGKTYRLALRFNRTGGGGVASYGQMVNVADNTSQETYSVNTRDWSLITQNVLIGCYEDTVGNLDRFFKGTINKVRIYSAWLNNGQIDDFLSTGVAFDEVV